MGLVPRMGLVPCMGLVPRMGLTPHVILALTCGDAMVPDKSQVLDQFRGWLKDPQIPNTCKIFVFVADDGSSPECPAATEIRQAFRTLGYLRHISWLYDSAYSYRAQRERVNDLREFVLREGFVVYQTYSLFTIRELIHLDCELPEGTIWWVRFTDEEGVVHQGSSWRDMGELPNVAEEQEQAQRMFAQWARKDAEVSKRVEIDLSHGPQRRASQYAQGLDALLRAGRFTEAVEYLGRPVPPELADAVLETLSALLIVSLARSGGYPSYVRDARSQVLEQLLALPELANDEDRRERLRNRYMNRPRG